MAIRSFVLQVDSVRACFLEFLGSHSGIVEVNLDIGASDVRVMKFGKNFYAFEGRYYSVSGTLNEAENEPYILSVLFRINEATAGFYPAGLEPATAGPNDNGKVVTWHQTNSGIQQSTRRIELPDPLTDPISRYATIPSLSTTQNIRS